MKVAFVGGTGPAGIGLGARLARAGHDIVIGSRSQERADEAAARIRELAGNGNVAGAPNDQILRDADVVFLAVADTAQRDTVRSLAAGLAGKIVVSIANPLQVGGGKATFVAPPEGSLAEEAQTDAPGARVVSAFHEIKVSKFSKVDREIDSDTIVCSDDDEAKKIVMELVEQTGVRPVDGGPLVNSRHVEAFVAVLVSINFRYKAATALRITGLEGRTNV